MPVQNSPDYVAGTIAPMTPADVTKSNAAYAKSQAANAAFQASPEGLAQQADAQNRAALEKERQAGADSAAADQELHKANAAAYQTMLDQQAKQAQIDAAKNAENMANQQKAATEWMQSVKDAADYHVNTDRSTSTAGLIAIALSGIGDALDRRHGPNAALQIIDADIDKRIADQWSQKKALGDKASGLKGNLDYFTSKTSSDREAQELQKASALADVQTQLKLTAEKSADPPSVHELSKHRPPSISSRPASRALHTAPSWRDCRSARTG